MLTLVVALGHLAAAEPPRPSCATLPQRTCDFFESRHQDLFVDLPDGTFTRNPLYRPADPETTAATPEISFADEEVLAELMDILDVPALSTRAKLSLSMNVEEFFSAGSESVSLPWPLKAPKPSAIFVDQREGFNKLEAALGRERFRRLRAFVTQTQTRIGVTAQRRALTAAGVEVAAKRARYAARAADPARVAARETRVREIFRQAKASLVRIITGGRPPEALSDEQKNLLARVGGLEAKLLPFGGDEHPACKNLNVNAFHDREFYDVELCPGMLWEPDAKLAFVFGHELAHAMDPCAVENDLARIDAVKMDAVLAGDGLTSPSRARLRDFRAQAHSYFSPIDAQYVDDPAERRALERAGALEVRAPRLGALPALYRSVYGCVAGRYDLRTPTAAQREETLRRVHQNLADLSGLPATERAAAEARLRRYLETHPNCPVMDADEPSHMNEIIADVFGTLAKEKFLSDNPPRAEEEKMLSAFNGAKACASGGQFGEADVSPVDVIKYLNDSRARANHAHPVALKRAVLEIDLPGLAAAAGCVRDEAGCFDHLSLVKSAAITTTTGAEK